MRRRAFLAGLVLLAEAPRDAEAQQAGKVFRIGATVATDAFYDVDKILKGAKPESLLLRADEVIQ